MVDTVNEPQEVDFDSLSDEEFMKLSEPTDAEEPIVEDEPNEATPQNDPDPEPAATDPVVDAGSVQDPEGGQLELELSDGQDPEPQGTPQDPEPGEPNSGTEPQGEPKAGDEPQTPEAEAGATPQGDPEPKTPEAKPAKGGSSVEGMSPEQVDSAVGFYNKITAPFKADGKELQVRSPEDAIRLMQQGANYSRRMQELKPMRQLNRMLKDHGLDNVDQLNTLIDLSKGNKGAIQKLLKEHNVDPLDLDMNSESGYQANNYADTPEQVSFRDALDNTMSTDSGRELIGEIHGQWDDASKGHLRQNPGILGNLMEQRQSGVYQRIVKELEYQKTIGYLQGVPFLQAYDEVGVAMKNAGAFNDITQTVPASAGNGSMGEIPAPATPQPQIQTPVASGARKDPEPKNSDPNPHLSSNPPSKPGHTPQSKTPDYDNLSDEDFMKMPPPA